MREVVIKENAAGIEQIRQLAILFTSKITDQLVEASKNLAPIDTGELHNNIYKNTVGEDQFTVIADTDYAAFVELGTIDQPAQPFLRTGIEVVRSNNI
jgi:HK97 gp10 family phage protein